MSGVLFLNYKPGLYFTTNSQYSNLEWHNGYQPRFGVTFVDREAGYKRIPKKSASLLNSIWRYTVHGKRE